MMHDFICCEEIPTGALTSNDVVSPVDAMLIGSVYGSVNISSILKSEILLSCKTSSTLIDTAVNGMLATVPIEKKGEKGWDELLDARVVIDVNTCIVK